MASELRVNTLKDASGNNSIATSTVFNGSAKNWTLITVSSGTPPPLVDYNGCEVEARHDESPQTSCHRVSLF